MQWAALCVWGLAARHQPVLIRVTYTALHCAERLRPNISIHSTKDWHVTTRNSLMEHDTRYTQCMWLDATSLILDCLFDCQLVSSSIPMKNYQHKQSAWSNIFYIMSAPYACWLDKTKAKQLRTQPQQDITMTAIFTIKMLWQATQPLIYPETDCTHTKALQSKQESLGECTFQNSTLIAEILRARSVGQSCFSVSSTGASVRHRNWYCVEIDTSARHCASREMANQLTKHKPKQRWSNLFIDQRCLDFFFVYELAISLGLM